MRVRPCQAQGRHLPWMSSGRSQYFWMTHAALLPARRWPPRPAALLGLGLGPAALLLVLQASPPCALASAPWLSTAAHVASSADRAHTCPLETFYDV